MLGCTEAYGTLCKNIYSSVSFRFEDRLFVLWGLQRKYDSCYSTCSLHKDVSTVHAYLKLQYFIYYSSKRIIYTYFLLYKWNILCLIDSE